MKEKSAVSIILLVFIILSACGIKDMPGPYGDNARYITLAKSINMGKGLSLINYPLEPTDRKVPQLYPLFLALLMAFFGEKYLVFNASSLVFTAATLLCFYWFMRHLKLPLLLRALVLLLLSVNPHVLEYSREALSEAGFMFFTVLMLIFFYKFEETGENGYFYSGLGLGAASFFIRYSGVILLLPAAAVALAKHKRREAAIAASVILFLAALFILRGIQSASGGYLAEILGRGNYLAPREGYIGMLGFIKRYFYEAAAYIGEILPDFYLPPLRVIAPHSAFWGLKIAGGLLLFIVAWLGMACFWRGAKERFFILSFIVYSLSLPFFPTYGLRYLAPVFILLVLFFLRGLDSLLPVKKRAAWLVLSVFLISSIAVAGENLSVIHGGYSKEWKNFYESLGYLRDSDPDEASAVICRKPYLGYLLSRHKTLSYPYTDDRGEMLGYIRDSGARYIIIDGLNIAGVSFSSKYLGPAVRGSAGFRLLFQRDDPLTEVYEIIR